MSMHAAGLAESSSTPSDRERYQRRYQSQHNHEGGTIADTTNMIRHNDAMRGSADTSRESKPPSAPFLPGVISPSGYPDLRSFANSAYDGEVYHGHHHDREHDHRKRRFRSMHSGTPAEYDVHDITSERRRDESGDGAYRRRKGWGLGGGEWETWGVGGGDERDQHAQEEEKGAAAGLLLLKWSEGLDFDRHRTVLTWTVPCGERLRRSAHSPPRAAVHHLSLPET